MWSLIHFLCSLCILFFDSFYYTSGGVEQCWVSLFKFIFYKNWKFIKWIKGYCKVLEKLKSANRRLKCQTLYNRRWSAHRDVIRVRKIGHVIYLHHKLVSCDKLSNNGTVRTLVVYLNAFPASPLTTVATRVVIRWQLGKS